MVKNRKDKKCLMKKEINSKLRKDKKCSKTPKKENCELKKKTNSKLKKELVCSHCNKGFVTKDILTVHNIVAHSKPQIKLLKKKDGVNTLVALSMQMEFFPSIHIKMMLMELLHRS